ncbi:unnamed protein product [Gadus morhua 'NCC']
MLSVTAADSRACWGFKRAGPPGLTPRRRRAPSALCSHYEPPTPQHFSRLRESRRRVEWAPLPGSASRLYSREHRRPSKTATTLEYKLGTLDYKKTHLQRAHRRGPTGRSTGEGPPERAHRTEHRRGPTGRSTGEGPPDGAPERAHRRGPTGEGPPDGAPERAHQRGPTGEGPPERAHRTGPTLEGRGRLLDGAQLQ